MRSLHHRLKKALLVVSLLSTGAIFGPVLYAAVSAFHPEKTQGGVSLEAALLVDAYRDQLAPNILYLTILPPPDGEECGYKPEDVFPGSTERLSNAVEAEKYEDYIGYYNLNRWRSGNKDESYIDAITQKIIEDLSPYTIAFLRRCGEYTVFSDLCFSQISDFDDRVERFDKERKIPVFGMGYEDDIVCTFVDGVAARKGLNLAERDTE